MKLASNLARILWPTAGINLGWRKLLYRQLCKDELTPNYPFTRNFYGLRYEGNLTNSIEANILFYGAFEKPLLHFLRDTWKQSATDSNSGEQDAFVDIGANIGQHSLFMSNHAPQVIAFEPFSRVSQKLKHHIALNQLENICLEEFALSDQAETLDFYAPTGRNQGIGSFDASTTAKGNIPAEKLELISGDQYFAANPEIVIKLMKIDVEGFERKVIQGLEASLRRHRPILVCEISYGKEQSFASAQEFSESLPEKYRLLRFDTRNPDGSKAKKRGSKAKRTGEYRIVEFSEWRETGQDDIIAVPAEKLDQIPGFTAESP